MGDDTLKFEGSEEDSRTLLTGIQQQFDSQLDYNFLYGENGEINGINIYGSGERIDNDQSKNELRGHLVGILDSGERVIPIIKVKSDGYTPLIRHGGMMTSLEGSSSSIQITEEWFSGDWSESAMERGLAPYYPYLQYQQWWNYDTAERKRRFTFGEALGHELVHVNRAKADLTFFDSKGALGWRDREENATISVLNRWRKANGIVERPIMVEGNLIMKFFQQRKYLWGPTYPIEYSK